MRPVGDTFVKLVKMVIGPIIFLTIVLGIANIADLKKVGRVGGKALLYFEIVTTFALAIGLVVVNLTRPGFGPGRDQHRRRGRSPATPRRARRSRSPSSSPTSCLPVPWRPSPRATSCRSCSSASSSASPSPRWGEGGRPLAAVLDTDAARLLPHRRPRHEGGARSGPSGPWPSRWGTSACARCCRSGRLMLDVYLTMFLFIFVVLNLIARPTASACGRS
jgi:aerobic C4-dicarboxylate transport protein